MAGSHNASIVNNTLFFTFISDAPPRRTVTVQSPVFAVRKLMDSSGFNTENMAAKKFEWTDDECCLILEQLEADYHSSSRKGGPRKPVASLRALVK